jgi:DNA-binding IclR family transcriptional regulator
MKTLEEQGYLSRMEGTELYRLGPKVLTLAARMLNHLPVRGLAAPYLRRLSYELGESVALTAYEGGYVVFLDCVEGPNPIGIFLRPGGRAPAHCVASGRVQLAFSDPQEVGRVLARLSPCDPGRPITARELREELALVRKRGYALDDGNFIAGVRAVAAPILDATATAVAAITVPGFAGGISMRRLDQMAKSVCAVTHEISTRLGYDGPAESQRPLTVAPGRRSTAARR